MRENYFEKKGMIITLLIIISLISIFIISPFASSQKTHAKTMTLLDSKKVTVMRLTATTAGAATIVGLLPGDATTPVANQIAKLSSYLLVVIGAIFLEKILLTLTGYITFTFIIPIACLLFGIHLYTRSEALRTLSFKVLTFGIVIFIVVPISVKVSNLIDETYQATINRAIENVENTEIETEETKNEETENNNAWNEFTSKVKEGISNIGNGTSNLIKKGESILSNLVDATAVLLITSCVIPIAVLFSFLWIIRIIFNVNIQVPKIKKQNIIPKIDKEQ